MSNIVALQCPNCGGFLDKGQMKCEYCGTESILTADGSSLRFRAENACPKCGAINERSSWFCPSCSIILTKDVEVLRDLQKRVRFLLKEALEMVPSWMRQKLEADEFIYFMFTIKGKDDFYLITSKRFVKNKKGTVVEVPLSEIVLVSDTYTIGGPRKFLASPTERTYEFSIKTYNGEIKFSECLEMVNQPLVVTLWNAIRTSVNNYSYRKKDVRELILGLQLG